jgi:hypothetical protein
MTLPLEISAEIQNFIRPVEGFRITEGQYYNMDNHNAIIIHNVVYTKNKVIVRGGRLIKNELCGFCIHVKKTSNKYHDMRYPEDNDGNTFFSGIVLSKNNLIR